MANYINSTGGIFDSVSIGNKIINGDVTTEKNNLNSCRRLIKATASKSVTIKSEYSIFSGYHGYFVNDAIKVYTIGTRGEISEGILRFTYSSGTTPSYSLQIYFSNGNTSTSLGASITKAGNSITFPVPTNFSFIFLEYTPEVTTITIL